MWNVKSIQTKGIKSVQTPLVTFLTVSKHWRNVESPKIGEELRTVSAIWGHFVGGSCDRWDRKDILPPCGHCIWQLYSMFQPQSGWLQKLFVLSRSYGDRCLQQFHALWKSFMSVCRLWSLFWMFLSPSINRGLVFCDSGENCWAHCSEGSSQLSVWADHRCILRSRRQCYSVCPHWKKR